MGRLPAAGRVVAGSVVHAPSGKDWVASGRPLARREQVAITHEQLAALAGTSRETTTKILGELAELGLISLGRGRITILDRPGLADFAGD